MKTIIVHLISEVSGQTVKHAADTALSKFSGIEVKKYHWPMVKSVSTLDGIIETIKQKPGIVLYTISNDELRKNLKKVCYELKLPCISVVSKIVQEIEDYAGVEADDVAFRNKFDEDYFEKVEAIDYTLRHDDGQFLSGVEEADIVLFGPSRASKTPTSIYLAYNGFKVANIPYVNQELFPEQVIYLKKPIVFGLLINPSRLIEIRENRMKALNSNSYTDYTDIKKVQEECRSVRQLCAQNSWKVIDVSSRSIEETAAIIMRDYYANKMKGGR